MIKHTNKLLERIEGAANLYVDENFNNPTERDYLIIKNAMELAANITLVFPCKYPVCKEEDHTVEEIPGDYYAEDEWRCNGAICSKCAMHLGWYCPKNSTHQCVYEDSEYCSFCGKPSERK